MVEKSTVLSISEYSITLVREHFHILSAVRPLGYLKKKMATATEPVTTEHFNFSSFLGN